MCHLCSCGPAAERKFAAQQVGESDIAVCRVFDPPLPDFAVAQIEVGISYCLI